MKRQMVMRTLLGAALIMSFVACGKAKNGGAVRGRNAKTTAGPTTTQPGSLEDMQADDGKNHEGGEIIVDPTVQTAPDATEEDGKEAAPVAEGTPTSTTVPTAQEAPLSAPTGKVEENKASDEESDADSAGIQSTETQRMLREAARYTGSGKDGLRELLQAKMDANDNAVSKALNLKTANSIVDAALIVDTEFREIAVKFTQRIDGKNRTTEMRGELDSKLTAQIKKSRGTTAAEGTLSCLDKSARSCKVAHARILFGEQGNRAVINIIFRTSGMNVRTIIPSPKVDGRTAMTKEQDVFYKLFRGESADKINDSRLQMEGFEVIQGASAARIRILTKGNEIITMKAPLLDFDVIGEGRVMADTSLEHIDMVDLVTAQPLKANLQGLIQEAILTQNTKGGGLEFTLMVGPKDNSDSARVKLQAQRIQTEINSGDAVNGK